MKSFLDLPAEVRMNVYHHLLRPQKVSIEAQSLERLTSEKKDSMAFIIPTPHSSQVLLLNKSINAEAEPVYYATLTIVLDIPSPFNLLTKPLHTDRFPPMKKIVHFEIKVTPQSWIDPVEDWSLWLQLDCVRSLKILRSSVEWCRPYLVGIGGAYKSTIRYRVAYIRLRSIALDLLIGTNLDRLEDKSSSGRRVEFQLSITHKPAGNTRMVS